MIVNDITDLKWKNMTKMGLEKIFFSENNVLTTN